MNKSFKLTQAKGKWHKSTSFSLGGGAKLYKNFAQKLLAVSLCMAMVLLGVPRGQNFVAEAAEEATKSVALLTLTATGDRDSGPDGTTIKNTLDAEFSWKSFVQGSTVDIELQFIDLDGSVLGPVNLMDLVSTGASSPVITALLDYAVGNITAARVEAGLSVLVPGSEGLPSFTFLRPGVVSAGPGWAPLCTLVDVAPPLRLPWFPAGVCASGLARVSVGSSVAFDYAAWSGLDEFVTSSTDESIAVYASGQIKGLSAGRSTLAFGPTSGVTPAFGVFEVAVADSWVPPHEVPAGLTAVAGTRLGDVALPAPTAAGAWAWVHPDDLLTTPGPATHKALYTPTDTDKYVSAIVDVPVEVYLEKTVTVKGKTQRLRVYNPNNVLPDGTLFEALAVTEHEHLDDDHEIEHLLAYDLSLLDASGNPLHMPLDAPVELCFEVLDGLDKNELEVVLVQQFDDREFDEELIVLEGSTWVKVKTDHFSPYALIDKLSDAEKAALNVKTGDHAAQMTVAGLSMVLVLALGVMLRLITGKKKFEE